MKILIIGGRAAIGKNLIPALSVFAEVITAGRSNCDIYLDLEKPVDENSWHLEVDVILHLAAHYGGKTAEEIISAEQVNVLGTLKVCQIAGLVKARHFILMSSIFSDLQPASPFYSSYSFTKKHAEEDALFFCNNNSLPLTILKPSQVYGCQEYFRKNQPFFYSIIDKAQNNDDILFYGSKDASRNFIFIDDLAQIIVKVIQGKITGVYPCMFTSDVTYSEIAMAALSAFNSTKRVVWQKDKPDTTDNTFEPDNKLYEKINFYPQISIIEGMKKIAQYRRAII